MATTTQDMAKKVQELYDRACAETTENMDRFFAGYVDAERWKYDDTRLQGMREAYATILGMLDE